MRALLISSLRRRIAAFVAVLVSAALGAALLAVAGAFFESGIRLSAPPDRLGAAELVVVGSADYVMRDAEGHETTDLRPYPERHRLDPALAGDLARLDGVEAAVPVIMVDGIVAADAGVIPVPVQNAASVLLDHRAGVEGVQLGPGEIALSLPLAERLRVAVGDRVGATVLGATDALAVADIVGDASTAEVAYLADDRMAALVPDGLLDAIGVVPTADADLGALGDDIRAAGGAVTVLDGDGRGAAEHPGVAAARTPMIVTGAVFGGIVVVVLATVISATVGLSVRQRAREISLLRAIGATGRQARRLIVGEAMLVGAAGTAIGVLAGIPLAHGVFGLTLAAGMFPPVLQLELGLIPLGIATVLPLLVVLLAATGAARPARRARAIDALQSADLPNNRVGVLRWMLGVLFGAGAIALAVITSLMPPSVVTATAGPAVLAGSISAALLAPVWLRVGNALLAPLRRAAGGDLAPVARANVRARVAALSTVTGSVALVIGVGVGNMAAQAIQLDAARQAAMATIDADLVVQSPVGLPHDAAARAAEVPGVAGTSRLVVSGGWIEQPFDPSHASGPWRALGVSSIDAFDYEAATGSFGALTGRAIAVPERNAAELGLEVGDEVRFRFGDGRAADLELVATFPDRVGYESVLLPADLLAEHSTARTVTALVVAAEDGAVSADVAAALRDAFAADPGVTVADRGVLAGAFTPGLDVQALINALLVAITAAYAAIAVVNTLAVTILSRRGELSLLRLNGGTPRQVRRMLGTELVVVTVTGVLVGAVVASGAVFPTAVAVGGAPFGAAPVLIMLGAVVLVALIVVPVTRMVARRAVPERSAAALGGS